MPADFSTDNLQQTAKGAPGTHYVYPKALPKAKHTLKVPLRRVLKSIPIYASIAEVLAAFDPSDDISKWQNLENNDVHVLQEEEYEWNLKFPFLQDPDWALARGTSPWNTGRPAAERHDGGELRPAARARAHLCGRLRAA